EAVVDRRDGLDIFSQPDVGEATESLVEQFNGTIVHVCCGAFPPLTEGNRLLKLSTPVRRSSKPHRGLSDDILETPRLTDAQGLFELWISLQQLPVHLVHCTEVNKTLRHHPLVAGFLGDAQGLFA